MKSKLKLFRGEVHEPNVSVRRDVREIKRTVVAREGGAADVYVLIRDLEYLMVLSRRCVKEINGFPRSQTVDDDRR